MREMRRNVWLSGKLRWMVSVFVCIVAAMAFCLMWSGGAWADTTDVTGAAGRVDASDGRRVYDMAGLLTEDEIAGFEQTIGEYRDRMKLDIVVVTTEDSEGKSAMEYADDFYDYGGFGYGRLKNGVLFLIDMDNRELYVSTSGDVIRLLTDSRIESILDDVYVGAGRSDFADSVDAFLKDMDQYYRMGIESGQYNYDTETGRISIHRSIRWYELLLALAVSGFVAGSVCMGVVNRYGMKKERRQAANYLMAYRADCRFEYQNQTDNLVNKFVTTAIIPRQQNHSGGGSSGGSHSGRSSTHSSSSGRSHGGGGRKF